MSDPSPPASESPRPPRGTTTGSSVSSGSAIDRYWAYIQDIVDGRILAGSKLIASAERAQNMRNDPSVYLDEGMLTRFVDLAERFYVSDGHDLRSEKIVLYPFQLYVFGSFLAWKRTDTDSVVFKQGWLEIARGNAKSSASALVAIFMALEEDGCEINIIANKADQARLILDSVKAFLTGYETFEKEDLWFDYEIKATEVHLGRSVIRTLASKVSSLDGLRFRLAIADEAHEAREPWLDKLLSALPKGRNYQLLSVSTPGGADLGLESCYYVRRRVAEECLKDFDKLKHVGSWLYGIDEWDDFEDPGCWLKGCPALGTIIPSEAYHDALESAKANNQLDQFIRYQCCRYSLNCLDWIDLDVIDGAMRPLEIMDFKGQDAFIGVDLSKSFDLSSIAVQFWKDQKATTFFYHYVPAQGAREHYRGHASLLEAWGRHGHIEIIETPTIDYDLIRDRLLWLQEHFTLKPESIGLDALGGVKPVLQDWEQNHDLPLVGIPQTINVIGPATYTFESLVREKRMVLQEDPVFMHAVGNVRLVTGINGDRRPTKEKSTGVIDPVIAALQATAIAIEHGALRPPAYRTDDDLII
ncbi:terminase large subunit [bacterium]|nr:terminase large subunit [bacterium]